MEKDPKIYLEHILDSINAIQSYTLERTRETFLNSLMEQDAVIRRFEIIGEAAKNTPESFKNAHKDIPWSEMAGMRNALIHEYFIIDIIAVWDTTQEDLPKLKKQIEEVIKELQ
ncbi:MAG: DUF86 domain-containing protein [bacterium]|nr:DUF86 domain-containing protein [bacterium]